MHKAALIVVSAAMLAARDPPPRLAAIPSKPTATVRAAAPAAPVKKTWIYTTEADPMTDAKVKIACVTSGNQISLNFPYTNTDADLCIRADHRKTLIRFSLNGKGQILCHEPGVSWCRVRVRFDDAKSHEIIGKTSADGSSNVIFLGPTDDVLPELQKSRTMLISLIYYQAGEQLATFDTASLKWPSP
jgi:hypothetical protein